MNKLKQITFGITLQVIWLTGCGDLSGLLDSFGNVSQETVAEAESLMNEAETILFMAESDDTDATLDELSLSSGSSVDQDSNISLAPGRPGERGGEPGGERGGEEGPRPQGETTIDETYYSNGRLESLSILREFDHGMREAEDVFVDISYSSSQDFSGDLNETLTVEDGGDESYIYTTVDGTTSFREHPETGETPEDATLTGYRAWHSDSDVHFLDFDLTMSMPELERAPFLSMAWSGSFDEDSGEPGTFERLVTFQDGSTDSRSITVVRTDAELDITFLQEHSEGFASSGTSHINLGENEDCRLDDTRYSVITRTFPTTDTEQTEITSEVITLEQDGLVTSIASTRYYSDGSEESRSQTRTVVSPTSCDDDSAEYTVEVEAIGYDGTEMSATLTHDGNQRRVSGSHSREDGSTIEFEAIRAYEMTEIEVVVRDATGQTESTFEISMSPDRSIRGSMVRNGENGEERVEIERDRDQNQRIEGSGPNDRGPRPERGEEEGLPE